VTTSAPQWPGQEGSNQQDEVQDPPGRPEPATTRPAIPDPAAPTPATREPAARPPGPAAPAEGPPAAPPTAALRPAPGSPAAPAPVTTPGRVVPALVQTTGVQSTVVRGVAGPGTARRLQVIPGPSVAPDRRTRQQTQRRPASRRNRFVVVRDPAERDLWAARRRARANLPSPAAVTREIALALLEVEAGCRSAAQLERILSHELWEALEHRIGRRGGPLPSGRSVISVRCQEDTPGLADTVAVVRRGDRFRPVALRLDAGGGRWVVTELRWWRNETDTATTPTRDGGWSR
jgi:hypothetical protein